MKRIIFIILFSSFRILDSMAQTFVQNPSFEGVPGSSNTAPTLWVICRPSPDIQPGFACIQTPPSHGVSYLGLANQNVASLISESIAQQLLDTLRNGVKYCFSIDLASAGFNCASNIFPNDMRLEVWGGTTLCGNDELLWQSPIVTGNDTLWKTHKGYFTPSNNYNFIRLRLLRITNNFVAYILLDNMSDFCIVKPKIFFTSPNENSNQTCSFTVTGKTDSMPASIQLAGKFSGSPLSAIFNSADTSWQANLTYAPLYKGKDTLIVTGMFANGYVTRDTLIINIPAMAGFRSENFCLEDSTTFTDTSIVISGNIIEWKWYFGDGNSLTKTTGGIEKYLYSAPNTYNVSLKVFTDLGCTDSLTKQITITDCDPHTNIFIPNMVTPNNDGLNDKFYIKSITPNTHVEIYNRWGEKIYENDDYKNDWNGAGYSEGIYFFVIRINSKKHSGWLQIVK
ncbi:MAG: gliding motility-associated C-terminal domain-containing protein [Cytophagaceae bacterium]|nr:gliding motility-associated C-terminal domain-containing protein [Cytophagaceae bacterium]